MMGAREFLSFDGNQTRLASAEGLTVKPRGLEKRLWSDLKFGSLSIFWQKRGRSRGPSTSYRWARCIPTAVRLAMG